MKKKEIEQRGCVSNAPTPVGSANILSCGEIQRIHKELCRSSNFLTLVNLTCNIIIIPVDDRSTIFLFPTYSPDGIVHLFNRVFADAKTISLTKFTKLGHV